MPLLWAVLGLVAVQRLAELALARRNTRALLEQGGTEAGAGHYPLFVLLHTAWLAAMALLIPPHTQPSLMLLGLFAGVMVLRIWVIASLGRFWTTRVITLPGAPLVRRGPYRWLHHPNYWVVAAEIALLPLVFGAWELALLFSGLNALLLSWRVRIEDRALAPRRAC